MKLFLIITGSILAAVMLMFVGCAVLIGAAGGGGGDTAPSDPTEQKSATLPKQVTVVKRSFARGENPSISVTADVKASNATYWIKVTTKPEATVSVVTTNYCHSADYSKVVNSDLDLSDLFGGGSEYLSKFKMPRGWQAGWTCSINAGGNVNTDSGKITLASMTVYRQR